MRTLRIDLAAVAAALMIAANCGAAPGHSSGYDVREAEDGLGAAIAAGDTARAKALMQGAYDQWRWPEEHPIVSEISVDNEDRSHHLFVMLSMPSWLSAPAAERVAPAARELILAALVRADSLSLDGEFGLLWNSLPDASPVGPFSPKPAADFASERRGALARCGHYLRRLRAASAAASDPATRVDFPESVRHPRLGIVDGAFGRVDRAQFADAREWAELQRKVDAYTRQRVRHERWRRSVETVRSLEKSTPLIEQWISAAYSKQPAALAELHAALKEFGIDEATAGRILAGVRANGAEK